MEEPQEGITGEGLLRFASMEHLNRLQLRNLEEGCLEGQHEHLR